MNSSPVRPRETKSLGLSFAIFLSLGMLAFKVIVGQSPMVLAGKAPPFLPAVLLHKRIQRIKGSITG